MYPAGEILPPPQALPDADPHSHQPEWTPQAQRYDATVPRPTRRMTTAARNDRFHQPDPSSYQSHRPHGPATYSDDLIRNPPARRPQGTRERHSYEWEDDGVLLNAPQLYRHQQRAFLPRGPLGKR